jgi:hypothetical protein
VRPGVGGLPETNLDRARAAAFLGEAVGPVIFGPR